MSEPNDQRALVAILREVCARRGIAIHGFSDDWVFHLAKDGRQTHVFGYDFAINTAAAKLICKDKTATSDLLAFHGIPRVEHRIFHGPQLVGYVPLTGNWTPMLRFFEQCGNDVVCKPNEGSGGKGVVRARTPFELEAAVLGTFAKTRSLCLSPYENIAAEYRVAVLRGEVQFVYRKLRPVIVADGRRTVRQLLLDWLATSAAFGADITQLPESIASLGDVDRLPPEGTPVTINWRHNLGQGSKPDRLDPTQPSVLPIIELALRAAKALGVDLASVDVVETPGGLKVLEINSGIMMENLAASSPEGRALAYAFYDRIVCQALGI